MKFKSLALSAVLFAISFQSFADTGHQNNYYNRNRAGKQAEQSAGGNSNSPAGQSEIINLLNRHKGAFFVEVQDMKIVKIMPDDMRGREHQIWVTQLSNGQYVTVIYNSDMCPRVPSQVGDLMSAGGNLIYDDNNRPILHWVHYDPRGNHPNGYVEVDGQRYCDKKP